LNFCLITWNSLHNLNVLALNVTDEGYSSNVTDEGYSSNVTDEGYSSNVTDDMARSTHYNFMW
jgi:hypothetical protein